MDRRFVPRSSLDGTFADAMERIAEHRRAGDYLVLMSASTDLYVPAIARELCFNETICTGVRWDGDRLNGSLTTPNRKGEEKARCFTALREQHPGLENDGLRQLLHRSAPPASRHPRISRQWLRASPAAPRKASESPASTGADTVFDAIFQAMRRSKGI